MARPPKNQEAAEELGDRLTALNNAAGGPTSKDIELWIYTHYMVRQSDESIRKAHKGEVDPTTCRLELLGGLAAFYGVGVKALGDAAAARFLTLAAMSDPDADETPRIHVLRSAAQLSLLSHAA